MAKLKKPAQVGNTVFGKGVDERIVIDRAQREYEYRQKPTFDLARIRRFKKFIRRVGGKANG